MQLVASDTNDTPVFVEVKVKPARESTTVVKIPSGSLSPSLNSNNTNTQSDFHHQTCPGIYKKGACPSPTALPTVIEEDYILEGENQSKNPEVVQIPTGKSTPCISSNLLPKTLPNKRKREDENRSKKESKREKDSLKVKHIGETNRSGCERGKGHTKQFINMDEISHLLKHYLQFHKRLKELERGMQIRSSLKSAI